MPEPDDLDRRAAQGIALHTEPNDGPDIALAPMVVASGRLSRVVALDPAAVMAAHEGDHWCTTFDEGNGPGRTVLLAVDGRCEPYRLAKALTASEHQIACAVELLDFETGTDLLYAIEKRARQNESDRKALAAEQAKVARVAAKAEEWSKSPGPAANAAARMLRAALADQPKQVT